MSEPLLVNAFRLARELHAEHTRKQTKIPYLSHVLGVASLVLEDEQPDPVVAAAFLHDAGEDQGGWPTIDRIRREVGDEVADLVVECSDSLTEDPEVKAPWKQRKEEALAAVAHHTEGALYVIAADKLHNVRAMLADASLVGSSVWQRFNAGPAEILWYHESMASALLARIPQSRSARLLAEANAHLAKAIG